MRSLASVKQVYKKVFKADALSKLLPQSACILCGEFLSSRYDYLCQRCLDDLPKLGLSCRVCSLPLKTDSADNLCGACLHSTPYYDTSIAPLSYDFPVSNIIKSLKYNNKILYSELLSDQLLNKIRQLNSAFPEVIIPVPLHPWRLINRGFNQSALIANSLARELKIPIDHHICHRIKNTHQQTGFTISQRKKNIKNAFLVDASFTYQHIAIVDDVITTGSTVNEMARVLKLAGAQTIDIWTCARTLTKP